MGRYYELYEFPESDKPDVWVKYSAYLTYRLSDDISLTLDTAAGWCEDCQQIVLLELVQDLNVLLAERTKLQNPDEETLLELSFQQQTREEAFVELDQRIAWRKSRARGSQCLKCGSILVALLPNLKEFPHPSTQELVRIKEIGFVSTSTWEQVFDSEGNPLPPISPETFPNKKSQE